MTAPNIVNVATITGKTAGQLVGTNGTTIVSNPASSGKVLKINALYVSNVDGTNNAEIDAYLYSNEQILSYQMSGSLTLHSSSSTLSGAAVTDIKGDGTKVYAINASKVISEYSLTAANDLSTLNTSATATLDVSSTVAGGMNSYNSMKFFNSGADLYITDYQNNKLHHWDLATPYLLSSASYNGVKSGLPAASCTGLHIKPDGTKGYIMPDGLDATCQLIEFSMTTEWDITTASLTGTTTSGLQARAQAMDMSADGTLVVISDAYGGNGSKYFTMTTGFDLSTISVGTSFSYASGIASNSGATDFAFNDSGTYLYALDGTTMRAYGVGSTTSDQFHIAKTIAVPANATLDVISKPIYLEEGASLRLKANAASDLEAVCSYEEIS
ncbi:hypothetical protein OAA20_00620 [bacterium]|nr:hypothetical protein [bacterium]